MGLFCLLRGGVGLEYDLVWFGLHCFLRLAHALYCPCAWSSLPAAATWAAGPRYRALAGKKGMVERQRRCDIVAVLPRLELAAVDVVVAHASAKSYAAEAAKTSGWTAARAERTKRTRFRKDVPDHAAFRFVPFAVETCGYMGKEAVNFVNRLGDIAAESGRIPKGAFVRWAMQLLSVSVQRGNAEMYRRSGLIISREQGLCYDAGYAVPVMMD